MLCFFPIYIGTPKEYAATSGSMRYFPNFVNYGLPYDYSNMGQNFLPSGAASSEVPDVFNFNPWSLFLDSQMEATPVLSDDGEVAFPAKYLTNENVVKELNKKENYSSKTIISAPVPTLEVMKITDKKEDDPGASNIEFARQNDSLKQFTNTSKKTSLDACEKNVPDENPSASNNDLVRQYVSLKEFINESKKTSVDRKDQNFPAGDLKFSKKYQYSPYCCQFCKKNGEIKEMFATHNLKNPDGTICCPILKKYTCDLCGKTGGEAHTRSHCPLFVKKQTVLPKYKRLSNGMLTTRIHQK
ncbi:unnamed protein product [Brassicogethes aeneus]|uniref:Nanos-type domain-containing protein n=1 Tax=Brassicogethes aeneus TaxID=1431903 RepID=A0A9P0BAT8_BRAAE|nr:unnamed protein product [Brassicogethes aeneus]